MRSGCLNHWMKDKIVLDEIKNLLQAFGHQGTKVTVSHDGGAMDKAVVLMIQTMKDYHMTGKEIVQQ